MDIWNAGYSLLSNWLSNPNSSCFDAYSISEWICFTWFIEMEKY